MTKTYCDICNIECDDKWAHFQVPANVVGVIDGHGPSIQSPMGTHFKGENVEMPIRKENMQVCLKCLQELNRTVGEKVWEMMDRHGGNPLTRHLAAHPPKPEPACGWQGLKPNTRGKK